MNEITNEELTGKYYFSKRMLGGFNIMVEETFDLLDENKAFLANRSHYRKATEKDLSELFYKDQQTTSHA